MFSAWTEQCVNTQWSALTMVWSEYLSVTCHNECQRPYVITYIQRFFSFFFYNPPPSSHLISAQALYDESVMERFDASLPRGARLPLWPDTINSAASQEEKSNCSFCRYSTLWPTGYLIIYMDSCWVLPKIWHSNIEMWHLGWEWKFSFPFPGCLQKVDNFLFHPFKFKDNIRR